MWLMSDIEAVEHLRRRLTCRHDKSRHHGRTVTASLLRSSVHKGQA